MGRRLVGCWRSLLLFSMRISNLIILIIIITMIIIIITIIVIIMIIILKLNKIIIYRNR
jgi:hypothetical protein